MKVVVLVIFSMVSAHLYAGDSPRYRRVLTETQQSKLTPDEVIKRLQAGNERFISNNSTVRDHKTQIRKSVRGQFPKAIILSCVDSRVPVEDVFDQGIGDVFVARLAGNVVNEDVLGSIEYAAKVAGVKLVMVMGHKYCGAVKSAVEDVKLGNITALLSKIKPAVKSVLGMKGIDKKSKAEIVDQVCHHNIGYQVRKIRKDSKILADMEKENKIKIIGAMYDMDTGKVVFDTKDKRLAH